MSSVDLIRRSKLKSISKVNITSMKCSLTDWNSSNERTSNKNTRISSLRTIHDFLSVTQYYSNKCSIHNKMKTISIRFIIVSCTETFATNEISVKKKKNSNFHDIVLIQLKLCNIEFMFRTFVLLVSIALFSVVIIFLH